jgi:hypothetical protein
MALLAQNCAAKSSTQVSNSRLSNGFSSAILIGSSGLEKLIAMHL